VLLCDFHRQNHEKSKLTAGHCVRKLGEKDSSVARSRARAREKKKDAALKAEAEKKKAAPKKRRASLKKKEDDDPMPNKAYNGDLPYPIPPRMEKYAGVYEGAYDEKVEGLRAGSGKVVFPNGDVYTGKFKEGMRQGFGVYVYKLRPGRAKPRRYEGSWRRSERCGEGKETWPDGSYYEGSYEHDQFHGKGTYYTKSAKYVGYFENGLKHGKGHCDYLKHRDTYDGDWQGNRFHGKGIYVWGKDNRRYEGEWHQGLKSGRGAEFESNGEKWEGEWLKGHRHGHGTYRKRTGKLRDGIWKKGHFILWTGPEYFGAPPSGVVGRRTKGDALKATGEVVRDAKGAAAKRDARFAKDASLASREVD